MVPDDRIGDLRRAVAAWARAAAAFGHVIREQDPSWGSRVVDIGGGVAALHGPGLYVNRLMGAGIERALTGDELGHLESLSAGVGVRPSVETTPITHPTTLAALRTRGYEPAERTAVLFRHLDDVDELAPIDSWIAIDPADGELLPDWQRAAVLGWGHTAAAARRASDAFAAAAAVVDGAGFVLARHRADGRLLGCASLTVVDGVATLGGMSTLPAERGRGVQSALIRHRLRMAGHAGCAFAASNAVPGGASERNLLRHGFRSIGEITTWELVAPPDEGFGQTRAS